MTLWLVLVVGIETRTSNRPHKVSKRNVADILWETIGHNL